jgi:hypothetical protein
MPDWPSNPTPPAEDPRAAELQKMLEDALAAGFAPDISTDALPPTPTVPSMAEPTFSPRLVSSPPQGGMKGSLVAELRREISTVDFRAAPSDDPADEGEVITKARSIARRLVAIVLGGANRDSIEASRLLFSYVEGLPVQPIEFDVARVVMELAADRGLDQDDINRAVSETKRIIANAKSGTSV